MSVADFLPPALGRSAAAYAQICLQPKQASQIASIGPGVRLLCLATMGFFFLMFLWLALKEPQGSVDTQFYAGICVLMPSIVVWVRWADFTRSARMQSVQPWLQLAPNLRRRLRRATVGMWLAAALLLSAGWAVVFGNFLTLFWLCGLLLIGWVLVSIWPSMGMLLFPAFAGTNWLLAHGAAPQFYTPISRLSLALLTLLMGAIVLQWLIPTGARRAPGAASLRLSWSTDVGALRADQLKSLRGGSSLYWRARCADSSVGGLLMNVFGPVSYGSGGLFRLSFCALGLWLPAARENPSVSCVLFMLAWIVMQRPVFYVGVASTRLEQGLLRLSPRMPQGRALNRLLGLRLLRQFMLGWLLSTTIALSMAAWWRVDVAELRAVFSCCAVFLLLAGFVLADYAGNYSGDTGWKADCTIVLSLLLLGVFYLARWPMPVLALFSVASAAMIAWRRWLVMLAAPVAFPAGRNGDRVMPPFVTPP